MFLFKKIFLGLGLLGVIYLGSSGTQSNSLFMQGMGFIGLIVGLIILYIFGRMVWKGLGCLPSFLILTAVVLFMMYALGMFNNGLGGIGQQIVQFVGYDSAKSQTSSGNTSVKQEGPKPEFSEEFPKPESREQTAAETPVKNTAGVDSAEGASANLFGGSPSPAAEEEKAEKEKPGIAESMISAIMGERAYRDMIRTGSTKASVRGVFTQVPELPWFQENGVDYDPETVIQREVYLDGKNVCRVNGSLVSVSILRKLGVQLINIHGQHDSASLFDENNHLILLDDFSGNEPLRREYGEKYETYTQLQRQIASLTMDEGEKLRKMEMLRYSIIF